MAVLWMCSPVQAWIYPEHRQIGVEARAELPQEARAFIQSLWERAHHGYSAGLCEEAISASATRPGTAESRSPCIDLPALPAIAGDHACAPQELIDEVLPSLWVHDVARVAEQVRIELLRADSATERENRWMTSHLSLEEVDKRYLTRAGGNDAHFLLSRTQESLEAFMRDSMARGAPVNALGLYAYYHTAALRLAAAVGRDASQAPSQRVRRLLALEAFALHFLEDMFAAGHVAGTWGDDALRKGTHDYYCAHGYATNSWAGASLVLYGDAHMREADAKRSATVVAQSLLQLFEAAQSSAISSQAAETLDLQSQRWAALDACRLQAQPGPLAKLDDSESVALEAVLSQTPQPGYGPESVSWPRYRADFGPFIGIVSSVGIAAASGGYGDTGARGLSELAVGVRLGYGLEAVLASLNTGTMYLELGLTRQSEQAELCNENCPGPGRLGSEHVPRVPSRPALTASLRLPFWLIPGDLLVLAPTLALVAPDLLTRVAIRAASGGLIPWQRSFATPIGQVELVAGRVVSATMFGLFSRTRIFAQVPPELDPNAGDYFIGAGIRALLLTFPLLELTPFRTFAQRLTAALSVQLAYAIDIPFDGTYYDTAGGTPLRWDPTHMLMFKLLLQARHYL